MSVLGTKAIIVDAKDQSVRGRRGEVVLETANTLLIRTTAGTITVEKAGTVLQVEDDDEPLVGDDILGKLEDRIRGRTS